MCVHSGLKPPDRPPRLAPKSSAYSEKRSKPSLSTKEGDSMVNLVWGECELGDCTIGRHCHYFSVNVSVPNSSLRCGPQSCCDPQCLPPVVTAGWDPRFTRRRPGPRGRFPPDTSKMSIPPLDGLRYCQSPAVQRHQTHRSNGLFVSK